MINIKQIEIDFYGDELSYSDIARKHGLTTDRIIDICEGFKNFDDGDLKRRARFIREN